MPLKTNINGKNYKSEIPGDRTVADNKGKHLIVN